MAEKATSVERVVQAGLLFDFYGGLLTAKQRQAVELYYLEDWSLSEIADREGVSRQAIFDLLQRSEKTMLEFEAKLGLVARFLKQQTTLTQLNQRLKIIYEKINEDNQIKKGLEEIFGELQRLIEI